MRLREIPPANEIPPVQLAEADAFKPEAQPTENHLETKHFVLRGQDWLAWKEAPCIADCEIETVMRFRHFIHLQFGRWIKRLPLNLRSKFSDLSGALTEAERQAQVGNCVVEWDCHLLGVSTRSLADVAPEKPAPGFRKENFFRGAIAAAKLRAEREQRPLTDEGIAAACTHRAKEWTIRDIVKRLARERSEASPHQPASLDDPCTTDTNSSATLLELIAAQPQADIPCESQLHLAADAILAMLSHRERVVLWCEALDLPRTGPAAQELAACGRQMLSQAGRLAAEKFAFVVATAFCGLPTTPRPSLAAVRVSLADDRQRVCTIIFEVRQCILDRVSKIFPHCLG